MEGLLRTQCLQETSQELVSNGAERWGPEGDFYTSGFGTCDFKGLKASLLKAAWCHNLCSRFSVVEHLIKVVSIFNVYKHFCSEYLSVYNFVISTGCFYRITKSRISG